MIEEIKYRIAAEKDYANILSLYNRMYKARRSESDMKWLVEQNPAGKAVHFIALLDNQVVGMQSLIPYEFVQNGEIVHTYKSEDSLIRDDLRGKGIFSQKK